jgi:hypothetical protein
MVPAADRPKNTSRSRLMRIVTSGACFAPMSSSPLQFLMLTLAGWMTRDQQLVTEYLLAENAVLRQQLRGRRIRYTDAQRRRLAVAAKELGRKALSQVDTLVTPDTLLRRYRRLVAQKYDRSSRRGHPRPRRTPDIVEFVAAHGVTVEVVTLTGLAPPHHGSRPTVYGSIPYDARRRERQECAIASAQSESERLRGAIRALSS